MWFISPIFESAESLSTAFVFAAICSGLALCIRMERQATKSVTPDQKAAYDAEAEG